MTTLVGNVVRLEPLTTHHTNDLLSVLGGDDEAWRWMIVQTPRTHVEMLGIINGYLTEVTLGIREAFAVFHLATQKVIGTSSLMDISERHRNAEIGSTIYGREFWRTGVNTETKLLLLTHAFEERNFLRVTLKTDNLNVRSQTAIMRLGAKYEGTLRSHRLRADGTPRDSMYYSILASEWPEVKAKLQAALA